MATPTIQHYQYVIIGAGIVGLTLAHELVKNGHQNILIIDKESGLGAHASGRNSGVLHSGIYYEPGTLKAQFCLEGNRLMKDYLRERGIDFKPVGKVVVAKSDTDCETIHRILKKSTEHGIPANLLTPKEMTEKEPLAKTHKEALWSPETAVVDPKLVLKSLYETLADSPNVHIQLGTAFIEKDSESVIRTTAGQIGYDYLINACGAHADRVAHAFGCAKSFSSIPFKGTYRKFVGKDAPLINGNIYPVPNLLNPFLGVHFTRSYHGDVYVGPTAIPAFGRENYGFLSGIDTEAPSILAQNIRLFFKNPKFRQVALKEPQKYMDSFFFNDAKQLVTRLEKNSLKTCQKVGIRPQLVHIKTGELVMDFKLEESQNSLHIINAISPAFTCSFSFAAHIYKTYLNK